MHSALRLWKLISIPVINFHWMGYTCMISRDSALLHHACSGSPQICHRYKMEATHCHHTYASAPYSLDVVIRKSICVCLCMFACECFVQLLCNYFTWICDFESFLLFSVFFGPLSFFTVDLFYQFLPSLPFTPFFLSVLPLNLRISFLFHWHHCILVLSFTLPTNQISLDVALSC